MYYQTIVRLLGFSRFIFPRKFSFSPKYFLLIIDICCFLKIKNKTYYWLFLFQGDSGGPLSCYLPTTTKFYLIGITSFGYGCGRPRHPGVYVRTINYISWINNYLQSKIVTVELHCLLNFLIVWWTVFHIL